MALCHLYVILFYVCNVNTVQYVRKIRLQKCARNVREILSQFELTNIYIYMLIFDFNNVLKNHSLISAFFDADSKSEVHFFAVAPSF